VSSGPVGATGGPDDDRTGDELARLYEKRFSDDELVDKDVLWSTLCRHFFERYVAPDATVLDVGAGRCEFINAVRAGRKLAVDLNPDTEAAAEPGVEVIRTSSTDLSALGDASIDVVFSSNFFEHLPDKEALLDTLRECRRVVRPAGRILVLMPNIRYLPGRYWDYLDHHLPLTHVSLVEALELTGFAPERVEPRFLPYTVKNSLVPVRPELIRLYLALKPLWRVVGKQMFVVARPH
jgi:SAM-dependent methyltransferase